MSRRMRSAITENPTENDEHGVEAPDEIETGLSIRSKI